mgnify:CR=1 FL=1
MFLDYYDIKKNSVNREVFWSNLKDADLNEMETNNLFENENFRIGYDSDFNEIISLRENS